MATDERPGAKILVVAPSWVGDLVMAQPLFALLAERGDVARIDALAPPATYPLLGRIPEVARAILLPVGHGELGLARRLRVAREIRKEGYGEAIVLPNSFKSALVPLLAGVSRRRGWRGEMRYGVLNEMRPLEEARVPLMADRYRALAREDFSVPPSKAPQPRLTIDEAGLPELLVRLGLARERPVLALCPGAEFGPAKRWPAAHFARVAAHFAERGWQVWALGSAADRDVADTLARELPPGSRACFADLTGRTTLPEAVDLIAVADAVLSNDSGLMHIATAVDRPVWVIYGSSSPGFTPPLSPAARVVSLELDCSPCYRRECPLGHLDCLRRLTPERVLASMADLLDGVSSQDGRE